MPVITIPPPSGGWNARDSLSTMPITDALTFINAIVRNGYVEAMHGLEEYFSAGLSFVHTIIPYLGRSDKKILIGDDTSIKDITAAGAPITLGSGFTGDGWQYTHFQEKLILTGGGTAQVYNGSTLTALTVSSGPAANTLWGCHTFKGRVYYWQKNSQKIIYCAAGSFQGVLTELDFGTQVTKGGYLVFMDSITTDGGAGADDLAVFVFSTGETLIYQGDDPSSASAWQLVGRYEMPEPLGIRARCKIGAETIVMTKKGYYPISQVLRGQYEATSDKIEKAVSDKVASTNTQEPSEDMSAAINFKAAGICFFAHIQKNTGSLASQGGGSSDAHYFNTANNTWARHAYTKNVYTDLSAADTTPYSMHAMAEFDGAIYFVLRRKISFLSSTYFDSIFRMSVSTDPTSPLIAQTGFTSMGGGTAQATAMQPVVNVPSSEQQEFKVSSNYSIARFDGIGGGAADDNIYTEWRNINAYGRSFSLGWFINPNGGTPRLYETRLRLRKGGDK